MVVMRRPIPPDAAATQICWQGIILLVVIFGACKVLAYIMARWLWSPVRLLDFIALGAIALLVGAITRYRLVRLQRTLDEAERRRCAAESLSAENEAVLRVARAVAREFAQPLSGALGYSELLMMRADAFLGGERRELEGMREGVLQLERLLQNLRQTIDGPSGCGPDRRIADDVERCVAAARPRLQVRGAVATVQGGQGGGPDIP